MKIKSVQSWHPCASVIHTIYDIVKAHGGEIRVESLPTDEAGQEGKGTVFTIQFPNH